MKQAVIVILNYNGKEMLERFLPIVIHNSQYEIIIADNASTDDSVDFLKESYPDIKLVINQENFGFSQGYNEVLKGLEGQFEYYILLNSDVEVSKGWDTTLVKWLEEHGEYGAVQPKVLSHHEKSKFDYAGAGGGFIDAMGYPFCRGRILHTLENDHGQYDDQLEVDWVSGACFFVKASLFHQEGGFEDAFFAHMEEIDLCWRLTKRGYKMGYHGGVAVYHVGGGTLSRSSPYKTYLNFRNNLLMLYKNMDRSGFLRLLVKRLWFDTAAALNYGFNREWPHSRAVWKAYVDFFKMKNRMVKTFPLASKLPFAKAGKKVSSIVVDYYLKGKKVYTDI